MTDLATPLVDAVRAALAAVPPEEGAGVVVTVGGQEVTARAATTPRPVGADVVGLLVVAAVDGLIAQGLLSPGTTVGECVPASSLPAGVEATDTVQDLVDRLGAGPPERRAAVVEVLGRVLNASSGLTVVEAVRREVTDPLAMRDTGPASQVELFAADVAADPGVERWETTPADLVRITGTSQWGALVQTGAVSRHGPAGRTGAAGVWTYDGAPVAVACVGGGGAVLAALDQLFAPTG
ncbi:hypothetical protein [Euzebya sp.]|uniref:hypothetical protein n=1 Tax=Euzebya sp. TaxID=1971409 RepID=UPI0035136E93